MRFTWDRKKAAGNLAKHGVDFRDAIRIFGGDIVEWIDRRFEYEEERWIAIGIAQNEEILVVYIEEDEDVRRILSARPATRRERALYWQEIRR